MKRQGFAIFSKIYNNINSFVRGMAMSKRKEKISAFLDNDLHRDELMSFSLSGETEDATTAQRYQIIADGLRGELSDASFIDVSDAVRGALANENIADQIASTRAPVAKTKKAWLDMSAWFGPAAGVAFAVMVAVVMVFTVVEQDAGSIAPVAMDTVTQPVIKSTAVAVDDSIKNTQSVTAQAMGAGQNTDIEPYINQHLEFATQDALQGRLPYVRAVSYETKQVSK